MMTNNKACGMFFVFVIAFWSPPPVSGENGSSPQLTISASPDEKVWEGQSIRLDCKVSGLPPTAEVVWLRAPIDPNNRHLTATKTKHRHKKRRKKFHDEGKFVVSERISELLSHGEGVLITDSRFKIEVLRSASLQGARIYRLVIQNTTETDSGDYECQVTGVYTDDNPSSKHSNHHHSPRGIRKIEIHVFKRNLHQDGDKKKNLKRNSVQNDEGNFEHSLYRQTRKFKAEESRNRPRLEIDQESSTSAATEKDKQSSSSSSELNPYSKGKIFLAAFLIVFNHLVHYYQ